MVTKVTVAEMLGTIQSDHLTYMYVLHHVGIWTKEIIHMTYT